MHSQIAQRLRKSSLSTVPPPQTSRDYSANLAQLAHRILYRSPLPSRDDLPVFILNASAFPDGKDVDYDALLPYVLSRLPAEEELIEGKGYEVVFFAGAGGDGGSSSRKGRPGWVWIVQAYNVLTRATRKRLQKLYIVHERAWVRIIVETLSTIVSPKSRKKILHCSTLTALAFHVPVENLLIPRSVYLQDRRLVLEIDAPYASGRRAFGASQPLPGMADGNRRLPRVLRESTRFILMPENIITEGIFRIPPLSSLLDVLREAYDRGQKYIVWREGAVCQATHRYGGESADGLSSVDQDDGYGVHLAAGLIKNWYARLREPLIPPTAYKKLRSSYGMGDVSIELAALTDLVSTQSQWSILPLVSRLILTTHLLPMLSMVAKHQERNRMTSINLALCFAPSLIRGPDAMEDATMSSVIGRIMDMAIRMWDSGLREACQVPHDSFGRALEDPARAEDFEDPLVTGSDGSARTPGESAYGPSDSHVVGVIAEKTEQKSEMEERPALPPRPPSRARQETADADTTMRRKPAPLPSVPPRSSTAASGAVASQAESSLADMSRLSEATGEPLGQTGGGDGKGVPAPTSATVSPLTVHQVEGPIESVPKTTSIFTGAPPATLREGSGSEVSTRKPVPPPPRSRPDVLGLGAVALPGLGSRNQDAPTEAISQSPVAMEAPSDAVFVKPTWSASARSASASASIAPRSTTQGSHAPALLNLAKPIQVLPSVSTPLPSFLPPVQYPKTRTPSPSLSQRFPPFQAGARSMSDVGPRPGRLALGDARVEDLKRLYEERVKVASTLVATMHPTSSPT
ncbi:MAG: hypothetical protein M1838_004190 [Thelocarpon superellum]|nr:MAG: hypothetical protein M1838_004190 [Thelocarpon superellum]